MFAFRLFVPRCLCDVDAYCTMTQVRHTSIIVARCSCSHLFMKQASLFCCIHEFDVYDCTIHRIGIQPLPCTSLRAGASTRQLQRARLMAGHVCTASVQNSMAYNSKCEYHNTCQVSPQARNRHGVDLRTRGAGETTCCDEVSEL